MVAGRVGHRETADQNMVHPSVICYVFNVYPTSSHWEKKQSSQSYNPQQQQQFWFSFRKFLLFRKALSICVNYLNINVSVTKSNGIFLNTNGFEQFFTYFRHIKSTKQLPRNGNITWMFIMRWDFTKRCRYVQILFQN